MKEELEALENVRKVGIKITDISVYYDFDDDIETIKSALERKEKLETENAKLKKLINIFLDWLYKNNCGEQADLLIEMLRKSK